MSEIEAVREFWFGDRNTEHGHTPEKSGLWFKKSDETDALILEKFGELNKKALAGECDNWLETPQGSLSLVIVLDQFSRNLYRNTPDSFSGDDKAREICLKGIAKSDDQALNSIERLFFYMPLVHTEELAQQNRAIRCMESVLEQCPETMKEQVGLFVKSAKDHMVIIERFGRFPHRNDILGRASSDEEKEFLTQPGSSF